VGKVGVFFSLIAAVFVVTLSLASPASARGVGGDLGRWLLTGASSVPDDYWQGLTSDPSDSRLFFIGPSQGLWQTTPELVQTAGVSKAIPTAVKQSVGYNHIGDPTWLDGEGGRIVLPMECYNPAQDPSNTCGKGAFGIADPGTLAFRYYVQLDPKFIPKAMWAETSPNGKLIWTSVDNDLLAYRASDVTQANAAPLGPMLEPVKTLPGAVPPTGVTGAVFRHGNLLIAGESNHDYEVWSVNTKTGARKLKIEQHFCGESEGLDLFSQLGGRLHWILAPSDDSGCKLTFGPTSALLHFVRRPARQRYDVNLTHLVLGVSSGSNETQVSATIKVTRDGSHPVHGATVRFADGRARTGHGGVGIVSTTLETGGRFSAYARKDKRFGISNRVGINVPSGSAPSRGTIRG
jgi:hypothetical protein